MTTEKKSRVLEEARDVVEEKEEAEAEAAYRLKYAKGVKLPWSFKVNRFDGPMSTDAAYAASGLDWTVATGPQYDHLRREESGLVTIYRTEDNEVLGHATKIYSPMQNRVPFDLADGFFRDSKPDYEAFGTLRGGREAFIILQFPDGMVVNGSDHYDKYMLMRWGHDGDTGFGGYLTYVRVVCQNTYQAAMRGKAAFKIEHYGNMGARLENAAQAVAVTTAYEGRLKEWMEGLTATKMSAVQVEKMSDLVFGRVDEADESPATGLKRNARDRWLEILAEEIDVGGGNAYSGWNSWTGYADHRVPVRKREDGDEGDERILANLDGIIATTKARGLKAMEQVLKVKAPPTMEQVAAGMDK